MSEVLDELVYHEDKTSHPISKLSKIWDEGFLQERIFGEMRRLAKFGRTLEEAARYKFQFKILKKLFCRDPCIPGFAKCKCGSMVGHPELASLVTQERKRRACSYQKKKRREFSAFFQISKFKQNMFKWKYKNVRKLTQRCTRLTYDICETSCTLKTVFVMFLKLTY